jgi:hypothetical protein
MKIDNKHTDESVPQSVTEFIKLQTGQESIQIGFTDQKVSGYGGLSAFAGFLHWHRLPQRLAEWMGPGPKSGRAIPYADVALGFCTAILAGAEKLAQVAYLRRDVLLPSLLAIKRVGSQSTLTRYFQHFQGAAQNLRTFRPMWRWCQDRLATRPGGYTLDLDSTQLLHEEGHQEGVRTGHTPRGLKRCLHPLLAVIAEAKLVAGFWLRAGHAISDNNVVAFTLDLLDQLPRQVRLRLVRADSGFCHEEWLRLLEVQGLDYIVVARLLKPIQRLLKKETLWRGTEVPGTEVAEVVHEEKGWSTARRLILIRHRIEEKERPTGKRLLDCPGYAYQALVTNVAERVRPIDLWRDYNGRAGSENVIKDLDEYFAIPKLCLKKFWSTEAALSLAVLTYNLCVLFQRHVGWQERVRAGTLRFRLFTTGGILSKTGGVTTVRLSVPESERAWWRALFEKIISPFPNCNSVSLWPG